MARLNRASDEEEADEIYADISSRQDIVQRRDHVGSQSPSPSASDKENRPIAVNPRKEHGKVSPMRSMAPPLRGTAESCHTSEMASLVHRKRKLADRDTVNPTQAVHRRQLEEIEDKRFYDPNQSMAERRRVRKEYRDLSRDLTDNRTEYLVASSDGLIRTMERQNELFGAVKQTSDATLDSRLLVSTADLSAKRTTQLNIGDSTIGIDVDDFVTKCITYMRKGIADFSSSQRERQNERDSETAENFDEGDEMNWEHLGLRACFPHNVRPAVPSFLLGPLSVQKRARKVTQRRERLRRRDPHDVVRPEELKPQDLEEAENSNLTTVCKNIRDLLAFETKRRIELVDEQTTDEMTEDDGQALLMKHCIASDTGLFFFNFVVNPKSFGQTVENLFYISFLIRDGLVALENDHQGRPTLHVRDPPTAEERNASAEISQKHQAVFHLDYETWEDLVEAGNIQESIVPHRQLDPATRISATGWYG